MHSDFNNGINSEYETEPECPPASLFTAIIASAPKDGSYILLYRPDEESSYGGYIEQDSWYEPHNNWHGQTSTDTQPTHWKPLPTPPQEREE